ncbi:uncharacterized protein [Diadema antillarum]|uniref:uncharacterized protein n=1 Tax=Diadema antillarum TaxID=105358 RepID=UPI003A8367E9
MEKQDSAAVQPRQHSPKFPDFVDYKHKLERRKRKPASENSESSLKIAKTDQELPASSVVRQSAGEPRQASPRNPTIASRASSPSNGQGTGLPEANNPSATLDRANTQSSNGRRQDVIVTPQSLSLRSAETGHVAFGEEAMDLSVRPTKDSFSQVDSWRKDPAGQNKTTAVGQREKQQQYQSTIKTVHNSSFAGNVYDSSDQSDGSQRCTSPPRKFSSLKGSSDESGSDFDCCARSSEESPRQDEVGKDDSEAALNPPRSASHMGGIESIVQRLHQVKSETPSRSDSEDESGYYAVTFQDLIARTISRCDRYDKTKQRGKRKRVPKTSSELSAARREEITAAKKLLERVSKSKRDKFKLTVNCSTDGSQHVRNAAASEAIATLVRSVWHKENPKPIGQVIKEMVARRLAGQEGDLDDPRRNNGQSKRKGPMTIKDILSSRSDNVVQEFERSTKHSSNDEDEEELMVVSDDGDKDEKGDDSDLTLSAAETLRKMAKINERRESDDDPEEGSKTSSDHTASPTRSRDAPSRRSSDKVSTSEKQGRERDLADYDSEDGETKDSDQKKKAKRRSRKKKRRWAKMFAKANKLNGPERSNFPRGDHEKSECAKDIVEEEDNVFEAQESPKCVVPPATPPSPESREENPPQWPAEAVQTKGSVAHSISQSLEKTGMGTMRSLVEQIREDEEEEEEEDVEVDVVEETEETPLLRQTPPDDHRSSPERDRAEPAPAPTRDPKCSVISHSISQILEQKSEASSVESRMRSSSCSSAKINRPLAHPMVLHEANTVYSTASSDKYPSAPHRIVTPLPGVSRSIASLPASNGPCGRETEGQEGAGGKDVKSISTATDFLIRFALMQNDGGREGAIQSQ